MEAVGLAREERGGRSCAKLRWAPSVEWLQIRWALAQRANWYGNPKTQVRGGAGRFPPPAVYRPGTRRIPENGGFDGLFGGSRLGAPENP
eukprot:6281-Chlamydomonas_euryale.AAC.1